MSPRVHGHRAALLPTLAMAIAAIAGCGGDKEESGGEPAPAASAVQIKDFKFLPPEITVDAGTTIRWTNYDDASHTASTQDSRAFDTGTIRARQTKSATVGEPGTFTYICEFHPFMKGTVIVR